MLRREPNTLVSANELKRELVERLFGVQALALASPVNTAPLRVDIPRASNVVGVGYGVKRTMGEALASDVAVRVYVKAKLPRAALGAGDLVPEQINGTPTDVIAVGDVLASVACGASIAHKNVTAGTVGALVSLAGSASTYVLSNNHVLANANDAAVGSGGGSAQVGDEVLQPAPADGGTLPGALAARLTSWVPLDFSGGVNHVDCALAEVAQPGYFTPEIIQIGPMTQPPCAPALYQSVRKWGRTTNHTVGVIMDLAATIRVGYGTNSAQFVDQLGIEGVGASPFSLPGDSGSLVVDAVTKSPVGLLFAGGSTMTFANDISEVLARLGGGITLR